MLKCTYKEVMLERNLDPEPIHIFHWPGDIQSPIRLLVKAGIGMSFILATVFPNQAAQSNPRLNLLEQTSSIALRCLQQDDQKKCSMCGDTKAGTEFYSKGTRTDSRCRPCVLGIKKRTRQQRKMAQARKPRGRVIDISSLTVTMVPAQISSPVLQQWVEFTTEE